jgi:peroxiredoxin
MSESQEAPQTVDGWFVLHEQWRLDQNLWWHLEDRDRDHHAAVFADWIEGAKAGGDAGAWLTIGQKADLLVILYRRTVAELHAAQAAFRRLDFHGFLRPTGSFLSVVEASLYEASGIAAQVVARRGIAPGTPEHAQAMAAETEVQKQALNDRVFRPIPARTHVCWYPMSKRRGETWNWYALPLDERRSYMRGHGRLGARYAGQVDQIISGAIGLDDWEWGVDLHADDPLVFKKLVTDMRFDPASSRFAEFGPFVIGLRAHRERLLAWLAGR